jgi:hypothetical protein
METFSMNKFAFLELNKLNLLITTILILFLISFAFVVPFTKMITPASASASASASAASSALTQRTDKHTKSSRKTIFLIRHAESEENRRLVCLSRSIKGLASFKLPTKSDMKSSVQLLNISAQIDSQVSYIGQQQITQVGQKIKQDDFVEKMEIQLVVHSPLIRARQTSEGMLECVAPSQDSNSSHHSNRSDDQISQGSRHKSVSRVVELDVLKEKTPMEWLPANKETFRKRIEDFEKWLADQPENVIAVVGHSQYFKSMLGLPKKFKNCDVWSLQFDYNGHLDDVTDSSIQIDATADTFAIEGNHPEHEDAHEVDGVRLDNLDLPKRWRTLKRHYTFSA